MANQSITTCFITNDGQQTEKQSSNFMIETSKWRQAEQLRSFEKEEVMIG